MTFSAGAACDEPFGSELRIEPLSRVGTRLLENRCPIAQNSASTGKPVFKEMPKSCTSPFIPACWDTCKAHAMGIERVGLEMRLYQGIADVELIRQSVDAIVWKSLGSYINRKDNPVRFLPHNQILKTFCPFSLHTFPDTCLPPLSRPSGIADAELSDIQGQRARAKSCFQQNTRIAVK